MYLTKKLKEFEIMGISSPTDLTELLLKGVKPDGTKINEQSRKELVNMVCGILYETASDIKHIQTILGN